MLVEMFKEPNLEEIWFAKSRDYQISKFCEKSQVFQFVFNHFLFSSNAASMESTGSDELDQTKITNLQEIIKPHPSLANRMYFL